MAIINLFNKYFLAYHIAVPLLAVDKRDTHDIVRMFFDTYNFNIVGFKEENRIIGYLDRERYDFGLNFIHENLIGFESDEVSAANTPLIDTLEMMHGRERLFLISDSTIDLLITKADLQKPPVRMLFFGLVTLLESEMADIIRIYHPNDEWKDLLTEGRLKKINSLYDERKSKNIEIDLMDCTQFADKKTILLESNDIKGKLFDVSKKSAEKWLRRVEILRNDLAHAQPLTNWFEEEVVVFLAREILELIQKLETHKFDKIIHE
ncbi:hypothetical protein D4T97_019835 [Siminovitchia acidinfaciens]|uniref:CBS domain-containing protein n=1 Tax=Siminovitchia acidinfaciens TaxID=2321395 RepID=A0A429XT54_9BACI|nr:hypothetical protein [Siminovitchia acidinfaciens]RST70870.1 hypothetical protein D4T97_019835 [Siminovitchia acidinfaciens]